MWIIAFGPWGTFLSAGRLSQSKENDMKELLLMIAKSLVDKPDEVEVTELKGDKTTVLELRVAKEDLGKVIGKQGKTAHAVRTILNATATKLKQRAVLQIIE
tara:strand:+ start:824 stop:1129 length:306 start_codon:yes stop_codon:yes gene_type:complete